MKIRLIIILISLFLSSEAFCSENYKTIKNISYGNHEDQKFDVYAPNKAVNSPVIFMVHGGGWRIGDKGHGRLIKNKIPFFISKNYVFISTNYRMIPDADPMEQARDVARAIAFAQKNAEKFGADKSKFILMGHSAGAHLISLLNADFSIAQSIGSSPWLGVVSLDSGALNVTEIMNKKHFRLFDKAFGNNPDFWVLSSPFHQLKPTAKPFFLVCSAKRTYSCNSNKDFAKKANSMGIYASVDEEDKSHGEINYELGEDAIYTSKIDKFISDLLYYR